MAVDPTDTESTCVMVTAAGSEQVHLALLHPGADRPSVTLCELRALPTPPTHHFQEAGCRACARVSLEQGIDCAREAAHVVVNLRRFYDRGGHEGLGRGAVVA